MTKKLIQELFKVIPAKVKLGIMTVVVMLVLNEECVSVVLLLPWVIYGGAKLLDKVVID